MGAAHHRPCPVHSVSTYVRASGTCVCVRACSLLLNLVVLSLMSFCVPVVWSVYVRLCLVQVATR